MNDEMLDVVNEQDQVIGQRPRPEIHRLGLRHRAAHVLVFNRHGQVFLQKRAQTKDTHPGLWDSSASGHLNQGEAYDTAAQRELEEELGWRPEQPPQFLFKLPASAQTGQEFVCVYRVEGQGPFRLHPQEIQQGGWFTTEEVTRWLAQRPEDFAPTFPLIWARLQADVSTMRR
jgi:isopentenyl-diphosphate delta-isomerase type 1